MSGSKNLLLVEDDEMTRQAFTLILSAEGHAVRTMTDAQEALDSLRTGPLPDCILLDLWMPGMTGRGFRGRQTLRPDWAGVPVVLISGDPKIAEEAAFLGAVDYLRKPVEPEELLEAIRKTS